MALRLLERLGYTADVVANGIEVLEAVRQVQYNVILMDAQMPEMEHLSIHTCTTTSGSCCTASIARPMLNGNTCGP